MAKLVTQVVLSLDFLDAQGEVVKRGESRWNLPEPGMAVKDVVRIYQMRPDGYNHYDHKEKLYAAIRRMVDNLTP